ncbi:MAG: M48 family metalloprotease [Vulcanimicrobiaceae bacterium]
MKSLFHRLILVTVVVSLLLTIIPAPVSAMSTAHEIKIGKEYDEDMLRSSVMETDPLMNAYVAHVTAKLWAQVARKDIPYKMRVVKTTDINAFSTLGGFLYVNEGLVDFVQSDDELAAVLGHETGHTERRHVVTQQAKTQVISILFDIASLFSPLLYHFGNLAEAGLLAKLSRADELQADRYGLQLMARAGYDPQANVTMMEHLGVLEGSHSDLLTKYLQDHPGSKDRVAHLLGYPELDPKVVTVQERLVRALSDEERARYSIANLELTALLKTNPNHPDALLKLGDAQLALGYTGRSEQTLSEVLQMGDPATKTLAAARLTALRAMDAHRVTLMQPNLTGLLASMQNADDSLAAAGGAINTRRDEALAQFRTLKNRIDSISYEIPDFSNVTISKGSRLEAISFNLESMGRAINSALDDLGTSINGVGKLDPKKPTGLLRESATILKKMRAPLTTSPIASSSVALFPSYPELLGQINQASGEMVECVDAARAATLQMDQAMGDLDGVLRALNQVHLGFNGDLQKVDYDELQPKVLAVLAELNTAAGTASQAQQLYNMARSQQLSARISLLGIGNSPDRYATLQYALNRRFGNDGIPYSDMLRLNLTPGDVTTASIIAADTKSTPSDVIDDALSHHRTLVDEANARDMHTWPLEIFTGLIYLDYTDTPQSELNGDG